MNQLHGETLEISFLKAVVFCALAMVLFLVGLTVFGIPLRDPLLIGFLAVMVPSVTFAFAGALRFMLRCRFTNDGIVPSVPIFYTRILRWEDIEKVHKYWGCPFYTISGRKIGTHCLLPSRYFLKRPESLNELIERYSPAGSIIRSKLLD